MSEPTACSACSRTRHESLHNRLPPLEPEALRNLPTDNGLVPAASEANDTATTQLLLTFDDNRRASTLFGQYGQNLALIERRLGVVADSRGNQVTIEGSRDGCERARRVLEGLYEQIKRGHDLSQGDVEGAIRLAIAQGSLFDLMDARIVERAMQSGEIEIAPLAFMRGRTLSNAVVILDEAQNTSSMQMKMFLTRLGENGRMIVTGDPSQTDLPSGQTSGLSEAIRLLKDVEGVGHVAFTKDDVVRHELVARIVEAYDNATAKRETGQ